MKTILSWSSGKDSAWSLNRLLSDPSIEIVGLLTTVNEAFDRVAMHGVRRNILEAQAAAAGLPLHTLSLPWPCSNEVYEQRMGDYIRTQVAAGVEGMAYGDLFLEDIRDYRVAKLRGTGLTPVFPLWGEPTRELADTMIGGGLVAYVATVDPNKLPASFAGRVFDRTFLEDLPEGVDPCGENGEFHTCVAAGPMFNRSLELRVGDVITRDGFVHADLTLRTP